MLFLHNVDNWKIYEHIHEPEHQRTEMMYQAWLGGLDRPYTRPRCMAGQPVWLSKKRHALEKPELQDAQTPLEQFVLEWRGKFQSFRGTLRPTAEDLDTAFDLVERPLDLSYAIHLLHQCRNVHDIPLGKGSFRAFVDACMRVDRRDVAVEALAHADDLGFWHVGQEVRRFLEGGRGDMPTIDEEEEEGGEGKKDSSSVASSRLSSSASADFRDRSSSGVVEQRRGKDDGSIAADDDDGARTPGSGEGGVAAAQGVDDVSSSFASGEGVVVEEDDELARLEAELAALEAEEQRQGSDNTTDEK